MVVPCSRIVVSRATQPARSSSSVAARVALTVERMPAGEYAALRERQMVTVEPDLRPVDEIRFDNLKRVNPRTAHAAMRRHAVTEGALLAEKDGAVGNRLRIAGERVSCNGGGGRSDLCGRRGRRGDEGEKDAGTQARTVQEH